MANDTLPLVVHTERLGRLICTREEVEADAVRVRVLQVVTPKTSWQRRILPKTRGRDDDELMLNVLRCHLTY